MRLLLGLALLAATSTTALAQADPSAWRWEQATPLERQAYSCAAVMMVLTAVSDRKEYQQLGKIATAGGMILNAVGGSQSERRLKQSINNGYISAVRDSEMRLIPSYWQMEKEKLLDRGWNCLNWSLELVNDLQAGKLKNPSEVVYPAISPADAEDRANFEKWMAASIAAWQASGRMTPGELKEVLRRELKQ